MDRYLLFNNLRTIFKKIDLKYKLVSLNGVEIDILDVLIAPLYLAAIQAQHNVSYGALPFRNLPIKKKISNFHRRVFDSVKYRYQIRKRKSIARLNDSLNKADIVFFPVEPTHLLQQLPVAKILVERDIRVVFSTNRIKIFNTIQQEGFDVFIIHIDTNTRAHTEFDVSVLSDQIRKVNIQDSKPIIDDETIEFVVARFGYLAKDVLALIDSIYTCVNRINPRTVVVGNDFTLEGRIVARICKSLNINSANIMHGSVAGEPLDSLHIADSFFLYGRMAKDYLVNLGISEESLVVTGDPHIDELKIRENSIHPMIKKKLNLQNKQSYILLALSGPGHCTTYEHFDRIVESVVKFSVQEQDIDIIAKLHRKDSKDNYSKIKNRHPKNRLHVVEYGEKGFPKNIYDWLQGCKLIITGASTVAIEAMLMQIPVITLDYMDEYRNVDFIDIGATVHVKQEAELFETIQDVLCSTNNYTETMKIAQKYVESYYYKLDGKASKRISDYLVDGVGSV